MKTSMRKHVVARIVPMVICSAFALLLLGCGRGSADGGSGGTLDRYHEVTRGNFPVTVLVRGTLEAIENNDLRFEGKGRLPLEIESIVEDKSVVKKGDPVVVFRKEDYEKKIQDLKDDIESVIMTRDNRLTDLKDAYEVDLQLLQQNLLNADTDIKLFLDTQTLAREKSLGEVIEWKNKYETAKEALRKYRQLDYKTQVEALQKAIEDGEVRYNTQLALLTDANQALADARLKEASALQAAQQAADLAKTEADAAFLAWEKARQDKREFRRFTHPQRLRDLTITTDQMKLVYKQFLQKASNDQIQAERNYQRYLREKAQIQTNLVRLKREYPLNVARETREFTRSLERYDEELEVFEEDVAELTLIAPIDGIVSIGNPLAQQRQGQIKTLEVGTLVAPKEIVARIPDLSQFLVKADIAEIYRGRLTVGQPAVLKNAALPDLKMAGRLESIAVASRPVRVWDPKSPRVYAIEISTDSTDSELVPGMTVEAEIIAEEVKNVFFVPIEAVYSRKGKAFCRVKKGASHEEVEVKTGRASDSFVEIVEGLASGDRVLLHTTTKPGS